MPSPENLIRKIDAYNPKADLDMVRLAFDFAKEAHEGQTRTSGEPYITHPLAAAEILADMLLPVPIVIAALLHDVPEDTPAPWPTSARSSATTWPPSWAASPSSARSSTAASTGTWRTCARCSWTWPATSAWCS
jgi:hypothetical protein